VPIKTGQIVLGGNMTSRGEHRPGWVVGARCVVQDDNAAHGLDATVTFTWEAQNR
jgi:hypothetical protein